MGYCANGVGYAGGGPYVEGLGGPKKLRRMILSGASPAAIAAERRDMRTRKLARKGTKMATGSAKDRRRFAALTRRVEAGTATRKERRLVGGIIPTELTARAISRVTRKTGGEEVLKERRADAAAAAESAAESAAAAAADREQRADAAAAAREERALDAAVERKERAADREAERAMRASQREEAATLAAEERQLALEEAEYERELMASTIANGYAPSTYRPLPFTSGGGGGSPVYIDRAANGVAPPAGGLDLGKILPVAAGAALLFFAG